MDSTEFFEEILDRVKGRASVTMASAALRGDVRLFAGLHVGAEVPAAIRRNFSRRGALPAEGLRLWHEEYLPFVYFVDVSGINVESVELDELSARDPSDLNHARLATLLAPVISLSADRDLTDNGFARPDRWSVAWASEAKAQAHASYLLVALPGQAVVASVRSLDALAITHLGKPGRLVSIASIGLAFWILVQRYQRAAPRTRAGILKVVQGSLRILVVANERHITAATRLERTDVAPRGLDGALITDLASSLARAPEPMTTTALARKLWDDEQPLDRSFFDAVRGELERLPAFVKVGRHQWQLGAIL